MAVCSDFHLKSCNLRQSLRLRSPNMSLNTKKYVCCKNNKRKIAAFETDVNFPLDLKQKV